MPTEGVTRHHTQEPRIIPVFKRFKRMCINRKDVSIASRHVINSEESLTEALEICMRCIAGISRVATHRGKEPGEARARRRQIKMLGKKNESPNDVFITTSSCVASRQPCRPRSRRDRPSSRRPVNPPCPARLRAPRAQPPPHPPPPARPAPTPPRPRPAAAAPRRARRPPPWLGG